MLAKLAPLEEWNVILSSEDRSVPRFCFQFLRIPPEALARLFIALDGYHGPVIWSPMNSCISAFVQMPRFIGLGPTPENLTAEESRKKWADAIPPPQPDPEFVQKAVSDIPRLCQYLEAQLDLADRVPKDFDAKAVTKDALADLPGTFDNSLEAGDHMPKAKPVPGQPIELKPGDRPQPSFRSRRFRNGGSPD